MQDRADPHARERAFDAARLYPPADVSPQAAEAAVRDVLGLGASDTVIEAWEETFWYLAHLLIAKKDEIHLIRHTLKAA